MISTIDEVAVEVAEHYECSGDVTKYLHSYQDSGGVWTIGIGTIRYPNGQRVKQGEVCTKTEAFDYYMHEVVDCSNQVNLVTRDDINQPQFDSLVDTTYNIGVGAFKKSTLLKRVNANLEDLTIVDAFLMWRFDNGQEVPGLLRRRMTAALLFFTGHVKYDWVNFDKYSEKTIDEVLQYIKLLKV